MYSYVYCGQMVGIISEYAAHKIIDDRMAAGCAVRLENGAWTITGANDDWSRLEQIG